MNASYTISKIQEELRANSRAYNLSRTNQDGFIHLYEGQVLFDLVTGAYFRVEEVGTVRYYLYYYATGKLSHQDKSSLHSRIKVGAFRWVTPTERQVLERGVIDVPHRHFGISIHRRYPSMPTPRVALRRHNWEWTEGTMCPGWVVFLWGIEIEVQWGKRPLQYQLSKRQIHRVAHKLGTGLVFLSV